MSGKTLIDSMRARCHACWPCNFCTSTRNLLHLDCLIAHSFPGCVSIVELRKTLASAVANTRETSAVCGGGFVAPEDQWTFEESKCKIPEQNNLGGPGSAYMTIYADPISVRLSARCTLHFECVEIWVFWRICRY